MSVQIRGYGLAWEWPCGSFCEVGCIASMLDEAG